MMEILLEKSHTIARYRKKDYEEMIVHFQAELDRLNSLRADGKQGRIEFEAWD